MPHRSAPPTDATTAAKATGKQDTTGPHRIPPRWDDPTRTNFCIRAEKCAVPAARRYTRIWMEDIQGIEGDDACESLLLIVSELVTNAVVHTESSWITCYLWIASDTLHVEVHDQGPHLTGPRVQQATPDDEHGRGLLLVEALAQDWGIVPDPCEGRSVWASVPVAPSRSATWETTPHGTGRPD